VFESEVLCDFLYRLFLPVYIKDNLLSHLSLISGSRVLPLILTVSAYYLHDFKFMNKRTDITIQKYVKRHHTGCIWRGCYRSLLLPIKPVSETALS